MYYEDRLSGGGFSRVVLAGGPAAGTQIGQDADYLRRALEQRLGTTVATLPDTLAPLVGLIARERAA
jgi:hypothetical protein